MYDKFLRFFSGCILIFICMLLPAKLLTADELSKPYSKPLRQGLQTHLFWGDMHVHTNNSPDAFLTGNKGIDPETAYRFAKGEEVETATGLRARLQRPLDFLAIADHAEFLGIFPLVATEDKVLLESNIGQRLKIILDNGNVMALADVMLSPNAENKPPEQSTISIWNGVVKTADRHNIPGKFTAFSAYEWTSQPEGDNLHRVVVFKDSADKAGAVLPLSGLDSADPEQLWQALAQYEADTSGEVLAIPHNGNLSNGLMFSPWTFSGKEFTKEYALQRARWEPVYEITQAKGDGETHPMLSPNDEFASFERWDKTNLIGTKVKQPEMLEYEYARSALKHGLEHHEHVGANPFKFGVIGSTDAHNGLSTTREDNYLGKLGESEPSANRLASQSGPWQTWRLSSSGLAAVWAKENTREEIFSALKRKEVYATTGPRISVRFFAGWDFAADDLFNPDFVFNAYSKGVPMGGDLTQLKESKAPSFVVLASKDPDGANLDRIQIVKGWLDKHGKPQETIYDVALSDQRSVDIKTGKAIAVGNTVDINEATYTNSIGEAQLSAFWVDPDFDSSSLAFYYARVIEIPKPRWTAYDAKFYKVTPADDVVMTVQDRAYTSPVWYTPNR